jgi:LPPG:FO 2-phospho-L-lactate transferase
VRSLITVLSGGVGGSRFLQGLVRVVDPEQVTAVVNTGDDDEFFGLYVSPDLDIVTYALAGLVDEERGWGYRGDTFHCLEALGRLGGETWFRLGDRDLATHVHRTSLLRQGQTLSQVTADIAQRLGVRVRLLPMSDDRVSTIVETDAGTFSFQEYLVKRGARDRVRAVRFEGVERARPSPGLLEALAQAQAIIIAPSNPIGSIEPILSLPGVRDAVRASSAPVVAVSPVVAGRVFQPPADGMMSGLGYEVSARGVARLYAPFADAFVLDEQDAAQADDVVALGLQSIVTNTVMAGPAERESLARVVLGAAGLSFP